MRQRGLLTCSEKAPPKRGSEAGEQLSFVFAGEAPQQDAAHGEVEEHLAGFDEAFIVLGEPTIGREPADGPFHHPSACEHLKAARARRRLRADPYPDAARPPMLRDG